MLFPLGNDKASLTLIQPKFLYFRLFNSVNVELFSPRMKGAKKNLDHDIDVERLKLVGPAFESRLITRLQTWSVVLTVSVSLKEIVEEVKKELHKLKDEIINGEFGCDNFCCFAVTWC